MYIYAHLFTLSLFIVDDVAAKCRNVGITEQNQPKSPASGAATIKTICLRTGFSRRHLEINTQRQRCLRERLEPTERLFKERVPGNARGRSTKFQ